MTNDSLHTNPLHTDPKPEREAWYAKLPVSAVTAIATVMLATGSATAWWTWQTISTRQESAQPVVPEAVTPLEPAQIPASETPVESAPNQSETPATVAEQISVQVYWLKDTGTNLELVPTSLSLEAGRSPEVQLQQAFEYLLDESHASDGGSETASTIPSDTQLNDITIEDDGIHVDLSNAFTTGGGSASMSGRLGQVIYTATTLDPNAPVWLSIDGDPLELLGGEGLMISQPMTRSEFDANFPM